MASQLCNCLCPPHAAVGQCFWAGLLSKPQVKVPLKYRRKYSAFCVENGQNGQRFSAAVFFQVVKYLQLWVSFYTFYHQHGRRSHLYYTLCFWFLSHIMKMVATTGTPVSNILSLLVYNGALLGTACGGGIVLPLGTNESIKPGQWAGGESVFKAFRPHMKTHLQSEGTSSCFTKLNKGWLRIAFYRTAKKMSRSPQ